jgi:hypothetical protein
MMSRNKIEEIFNRELDRLDDLSKQGPLESEDIRKLAMLVDAHKKFEAKAPTIDTDLTGLEASELLKMLRRIDGEEDKAAGEQPPSQAPSQEADSRSTLETGKHKRTPAGPKPTGDA